MGRVEQRFLVTWVSSRRWPDAYAGFLLKVPEKGLTLVALGNTDGLNWENRLQVAEIENSPLALKFLELIAAE